MENEANSVEDAAWARETRLAAGTPTFHLWLVISLTCLTLSVIYTMLIIFLTTRYPQQFIQAVDQPPALTAAQMLMPIPVLLVIFLVSSWMTRRNYSPLSIIGLHLTSFLTLTFITNFVTVPISYEYVQTHNGSYSTTSIGDLLPAISISAPNILLFLAWMALPTFLGILSAKRSRRFA